MNKFQKMIITSNSKIKEFRGNIIATKVERSHKKVVDKLKDEVLDLQDKLNSLSDIYPDSELTLRVTSKDFNPDTWAAELQEVKLALALKEQELELAEETTKEFFSELPDDEEESK